MKEVLPLFLLGIFLSLTVFYLGVFGMAGFNQDTAPESFVASIAEALEPVLNIVQGIVKNYAGLFSALTETFSGYLWPDSP